MRKRLAAMQDWPLLMQRACDGGCDGGVERGRGHDDEGIAAAEFEDGFLDEPSGLGGDGAAGGLASGDGDGGDTLIGKHRLHLAGFDEQGLEARRGESRRGAPGLRWRERTAGHWRRA